MEQKCANAAHPDSYGHYREASVTAIKHHWWWKVCSVVCILCDVVQCAACMCACLVDL